MHFILIIILIAIFAEAITALAAAYIAIIAILIIAALIGGIFAAIPTIIWAIAILAGFAFYAYLYIQGKKIIAAEKASGKIPYSEQLRQQIIASKKQ